MEFATVPVVDMQSSDFKDLSNEEQVKAIGGRIFREFKENGYVYLQNHGLTEPLLQSTFQSARAFFALPLETKLKYNRFGSPDINGYTPPSSEVVSCSESESSCDLLELKEAWNTRQFDRNLPTEDAPHFCRDLVALNATFEVLSMRVLAGLEVAMGRPGLLTNSHREGNRNSDLRAAYYPALLEPVPAGAVRCGTHSDFGSITFLLQEDCGGLEVLSRSGGWVPAPAVPGAVLVIAGDILEIWTGGEILATKHRVRVPEEERLRRMDRLSLVFFCSPQNDTLVVPPPGSEGYQSVGFGEYLAAKMLAISPTAQQMTEA